jgi:polar amino acid transport system substrate-binding protein
MWFRLAAAGLAAALGLAATAAGLQARPFALIKERGRIMVCANPNALPFAAKNGERPGFQLELAKALAAELGVELEIGWVVFPLQVSRVDCDIILDAIVDEEVQAARRVKLSHPYQQSGVVMAFRSGVEPAADLASLKPGLRIAAMVGSMAQVLLGKRGVATIPFTFEDEMIAAVGSGEVDAAVISPASVGFYTLTHPDAGVQTAPVFSSIPELNWSLAVGMRKADDALVETVNGALDKLMADGTVNRIYASYGIEHRVPKQ